MEFFGEKLALKLWDTLADRGMAGLLRPRQIRREGDATLDVKRRELLAIAQAEKDAEDLRKGVARLLDDGRIIRLEPSPVGTLSIEHDGRIEPSLGISNFAEAGAQNEAIKQIRAEINVSKAVLMAEELLLSDATPPSEEKVDDDWLHAWHEYAGRFSHSDLQQLWAGVLAGEVKTPGAFSLRTLEALKTLSKEEAKLIEKIAPFVISDRILRTFSTYFEREDIGYNDFLILQEIGILSGVDAMLETSFPSNKNDKYARGFICNDRCLLAYQDNRDAAIAVEVYLVTKIGQQILQLGNHTANQSYLNAFAQSLLSKGYEVQIGKIRKLPDGAQDLVDVTPVVAS